MVGQRRRKDDADRNRAHDDNGKPAPVLIGFRAVYVFERLSRDLWPRFYTLDPARDAPEGARR
jgi:hypothetical protein